MQKNKRLVFVILFVAQILLNNVLKHYPEFVERYYSHGIYIFLSKLMRYTFGWLPFSVGDLFYTVASIYLIRWLIVNRKRIITDTKNWLLDVGATLSIAFIAFHILWAFNYYRQPLHKSLNLESDYTTHALVDLTERLIKKSNDFHNKLSPGNDSLKIEIPYSKSEIFDMVQNGYDELAKTYSHLKYEPTSIKKSIYSIPLTYMGFSGYLNPFTNEAQVDGLIPVYKFPTTSCHEVAHQLGYAAENEANFFGGLAAIHNKDNYFKYAGYTFALRYCLSELFRRDADIYYSILPTLNYGIIRNYQEIQTFWMDYENPLEPYFEKTFDRFLKANNQSDGMKSYNYVVALFVNYFKDRPL
ncbi:DUF3810 domain-containing protein [Winogradskyella alexanderae]|uniref:DUF3810 domain-containing protein n=1 Tax=Winogradskyella alexanderae TaxID=2877123 RepID=A0ABS7XQ36_9FLAO|nr:DUF3810 domain-containing protein [Winogradskyella alexanderae]MCA0132124.1 DUF3810 domain-containing protein [Winogradskyella alexanderae]